jgi:succinyl-diaminopimelate desuccinylase
MKSGIACFMAAAAAYLAQGGSAAGSIALAITGDEEAQSINGTAKLLRWAADRGEHWDAALVGEPTSPSRLGEAARIGRRGSLTARLAVRGRQGHTAYPHRADNAAHRLIAGLHELVTTRLDEGSEAFEPSTLQVTSIDIGNPASNVIPGEARATLNIRFNDHHSRASLEAWLRRTIGPHASQLDLEIECNAEPFLTQPGRLSETLSAAVEEVTGLRPVLNTAGGTSDARFIHPYCPVVEFGLVGTTMHQSDERVALADIDGLTRVYEAFLRRYLGPAQSA